MVKQRERSRSRGKGAEAKIISLLNAGTLSGLAFWPVGLETLGDQKMTFSENETYVLGNTIVIY